MLLKSCQFFNRHLPNVRWSAKKIFLWKSAIFHSIKPPFDAEVAEKFLNGIYCSSHTSFLVWRELLGCTSCNPFIGFMKGTLKYLNHVWVHQFKIKSDATDEAQQAKACCLLCDRIALLQSPCSDRASNQKLQAVELGLNDLQNSG